MELDIKKILYATDLSPNSSHAMRYAAKIARQNEAKLVVLHVVEKMSATTQALLSAYLDEGEINAKSRESIAYHIEKIRKRLDRFCEKECRYDAQLLTRVERIDVHEGFPADEILKEANEIDADIIVMGTHGKGALENTFVGSVAQRVLRRSSRPVLVVPLPKGQTDLTVDDA
jgi:nucleotide-binding universal stress UspA family protein